MNSKSAHHVSIFVQSASSCTINNQVALVLVSCFQPHLRRFSCRSPELSAESFPDFLLNGTGSGWLKIRARVRSYSASRSATVFICTCNSPPPLACSHRCEDVACTRVRIFFGVSASLACSMCSRNRCAGADVVLVLVTTTQLELLTVCSRPK